MADAVTLHAGVHGDGPDLGEVFPHDMQGTAADIIKVAMINLQREIDARELKSRILLQVHDELILEVAHGERDRIGELVKDTMSSAIELSVPLDVSVGFGPSWDAAAH